MYMLYIILYILLISPNTCTHIWTKYGDQNQAIYIATGFQILLACHFRALHRICFILSTSPFWSIFFLFGGKAVVTSLEEAPSDLSFCTSKRPQVAHERIFQCSCSLRKWRQAHLPTCRCLEWRTCRITRKTENHGRACLGQQSGYNGFVYDVSNKHH